MSDDPRWHRRPTGAAPGRQACARRPEGRARVPAVVLAAALSVLLALGAVASPTPADAEPGVDAGGAPGAGTPSTAPPSSTAPAPTPSTTPSAPPSPRPSPTSTSTATPRPVGGTVVGRVVDGRGSGVPRARVALFDTGWRYLRDTRARQTGRFAFSDLAPGRYRLQVTDTRPAWRTDLFAPRDTVATVRARRTSVLTVTVRRGAHLTGHVTRGPRAAPAARALVRATDAHGRHHQVRADRQGRFALGGLARGTYRVWIDDAAHRWVGPTTVVHGVSRSTSRHLELRLRTRAGGLNGFVLADGEIARHTTWVTAVHRRTGQWRVVRVRNGDLSLRGLAPGRYDFTLTATRTHAGRTVRNGARVHPGRTSPVTLRLGRKLG